ncbi:glucan biosynthesis protein G [Rhodoblastus acidophilus]|uniref:Glucan biosynthesis protein G n=1 Tax=Rhodoblastus acidophilus TaxID=1074 RepID=A0A6N8DH32_RHOAC|nr:glucan biosynthesis protein G [Rhodoblastus acidophilus]MCW2272729.1 glucans biosynthesis protein [Rhodoblastus acidophilus]MTV29640.1 glucan biosynthesis protein G [Rhodoblastus acidophilus]
MPSLDRRFVLSVLAASGAAALAPPALAKPAYAQPGPSEKGQPPQPQKFNFEDVLKRAKELAAAPYDAMPPKLPEALGKLDFDSYRDIRFKAEKSPLNVGPFRLQLFHPGFIYTRPVVVNTIRDGIATPIPYSANLFDYGRNKFDHNLPVNLGFAGFRLHYPLNSAKGNDELVSFLGATYFRFLGRGQSYGLSARGLSVNTGGDDEEFPLFREFWIDVSEGAERGTIYALLDSASVTGAFRFDLYPGVESVVEVTAAIIPRRPDVKFGLAPLTSMFFTGEDSPRPPEEYRQELHDSDGLLMHTGVGEWIWRPLRAPRIGGMSTFEDKSIKGFGLVQRDRNFDRYQDIELSYETRPTYFVEPHGDWGEGRIELLELATKDETADNIVAYWTPQNRPEAGKPFYYSYRIRSLFEAPDLSPNGRLVNLWKTVPKALGSSEQVGVGSRRFILDFAGGDLGYYLTDPSQVEVSATASRAKVLRTFIAPNPHVQGFRAMIDVQTDPGVSAEIRAFLRAGPRALTETALIPWIAE